PLVPDPPDYQLHVDRALPVDLVWRYINPRMLFGRHLGLRGNALRLLEEGRWRELERSEGGRKAIELRDAVDSLKAEIRAKKLLHPRAVWQYLPAESEGNKLHILDASRKNARA